jgi:hypothetical protein
MSRLPFMQGQKVFYVGQKHRQTLTREGKPLVGWIHAAVEGAEGTYVVFYPETKHQDSYILSQDDLSEYRPAAGKREDGPEIAPRRVKKEDE